MATGTSTIVEIVTPGGGESVSEGTILRWAVGVGERVREGETGVEISTDKIDMELPAPASGELVEILAQEGETVGVGQVIGRIRVGEGGAPANGEAPRAPSPGERKLGAQAATAAPASPPKEAEEVARTREIVEIVTPGGGESVSEGTILRWAVGVGERVREGETVVEISTDKIDMELPAPASGELVEILAQEGETVGVGQVIGRIRVGEGGAPANGEAPRAPSPGERKLGAQAATAAPASPPKEAEEVAQTHEIVEIVTPGGG